MYAADFQDYLPPNTRPTQYYWYSRQVVEFWRGYLLPFEDKQRPGETDWRLPSKENLLFCPNDQAHRTLALMYPQNDGTKMCGYYYIPHRNTNDGVGDYDVTGIGSWHARRKLNTELPKAPVLVDCLKGMGNVGSDGDV